MLRLVLCAEWALQPREARLPTTAMPQLIKTELELVSRVVVELIYAAVEMIFDEPLDVKPVARTVASHMARINPDRDSERNRPRRKSARGK